VELRDGKGANLKNGTVSAAKISKFALFHKKMPKTLNKTHR
jgi:hypothetical protein